MAVINCPHCERGQVEPEDPTLARCPVCGRTPEGWVLETLEEITSLPDALGSHACENCGHPQMRHLPDQTFWCPGCGEEILSLKVTLTLWEFKEKSEAYRRGWVDGYLGVAYNLSSSIRMARGQGAPEMLDYYEGHLAGSQQRLLPLEQVASQVGNPSEKVGLLYEAS